MILSIRDVQKFNTLSLKSVSDVFSLNESSLEIYAELMLVFFCFADQNRFRIYQFKGEKRERQQQLWGVLT